VVNLVFNFVVFKLIFSCKLQNFYMILMEDFEYCEMLELSVDCCAAVA